MGNQQYYNEIVAVWSRKRMSLKSFPPTGLFIWETSRGALANSHANTCRKFKPSSLAAQTGARIPEKYVPKCQCKGSTGHSLRLPGLRSRQQPSAAATLRWKVGPRPVKCWVM